MSKTTLTDLCFHQGGIEPHRSATAQDLIEAVESIGLRVAGPDDLVIRREDYDAVTERACRVMRSWLVEDNDVPLRSAVKAALAATEGEETDG